MNVLSLFDGMSCGNIALNRVGIHVDKYYASEIDKWAIKVTQENFPSTIQLGDIENWRDWDLDWSSIGLLIGGSPCQGFSYSGKKLAFDDPRSKLFFTYVDILSHICSLNPRVEFLLENVRMKKDFLNIITDHLGVDPVYIDSRDFSALSRPRYYWSNISFEEPRGDKGVTLSDILEAPREDMPWLTDKAVARLDAINRRAKEKGLGYKDCILTGEDKFLNLDANFFKGPDGKRGVIKQEGRLRMPTPLECERLQTVPDFYTKGVSNTQRYKLLGNGWTVDVISHILKGVNQ